MDKVQLKAALNNAFNQHMVVLFSTLCNNMTDDVTTSPIIKFAKGLDVAELAYQDALTEIEKNS